MMNIRPPKWADKFLEWYCHPALLEEIQGDAYELFYRRIKTGKTKAKFFFILNVLRFFKLKNIRPFRKRNSESYISIAMIKNMLLITVRNFFRQPGHSFMNVFGLATGFTSAFLILLWVAQESSFDKFHEEPENVYKILTHVRSNGNVQTYDAAPGGIDVSSVPEIKNIVTVSTGSRWPHELCFRPEGRENECVYKNGVYATEGLFSAFNFSIIHGDKNPLKESGNIAISESMSIALFGDVNAVGKLIRIDDRWEVAVASVFRDVPVNSSLKFDFALTMPILLKEWGINKDVLDRSFFLSYIRTNNAIDAGELTSKLNHAQVLTEEYRKEGVSYEAYPLTSWRLKSKFENGHNAGGRIEYVVLFIIIALLIVIMAVINFVNMSTARATLRAKEIGVRKVTGAVRGAIIAQFMGESFIIVLIAFVISVGATQLLLPMFNLLISEPVTLSIISGSIPLYLFGFLVFVTFLSGIYPAMVMSSFQPARILKSQFSNTNGSQRLRGGLLVIQLSVSVGIIVFAGVLYNQLNFIVEKDLGFDRSNMIRVEPTFKITQRMEVLKNDLLKNPAIVSVGCSASNPLSLEGSNTGVSWPGKSPETRISFKTFGCSYDFPETMGLKIKAGRFFEQKSLDSVRSEVLVTEQAVKTMGLVNPVGEEISIGDRKCVIIGVVNDFHSESLHEIRLPAILYRVGYQNISAIYVRYQQGKTAEAKEAVTAAYNSIEQKFTMRYWFQDETFNEIYKTEIIASRLVLIFTIVTLVIAVIGMVGLITFNIMRKGKEIGIRRVFGATMNQIIALLFNEFSIVLFLAFAIGGTLSWYAANYWISGFAYHAPMPYMIFIVTFAGVVTLIGLIIWIQSLKTISTNPTDTLRSE